MKRSAYAESARPVSTSDLGIVFRHALPNIIATMIVLAIVYLESAILIEIEAPIGHLGVGLLLTIPS
jgi:ABC-type dipeptide/oligopeptide/nickel transport system permease subunit